MEINERKEKILTIENEFMNIGDTLRSYILELHDTHQNLMSYNDELNQKLNNLLSILESSRANINVLENTMNSIKEQQTQLEKRIIEDRTSTADTNELVNQITQLIMVIQENHNIILSKFENIESNFQIWKIQVPKLQENLQCIVDVIQKINKENNESTETAEILQHISQMKGEISNLDTLFETVKNSINDIQNQFSNQRTNLDEFKSKLLSIEEIVQTINQSFLTFNELALKIVKIDDFQNALIQNYKSIENLITSEMTTLNDTLTTRNNQLRETIDGKFVEFNDNHNVIKNNIVAIDRALSKNQEITQSNITALTNGIDDLLKKVEIQNQSLQKLHSSFNDKLFQMVNRNQKLQLQNTLLIVIIIILLSISGIIAVILI